MKPALPALLISPDAEARLAIMLHKKQITIREGFRDYVPGPVMLCCHLVPWVIMATITSVRHTLLSEVTREEYEADGYSSPEQMLADLQKYYPKMHMQSQVTVIKWDKLEGFYTEIDNVAFYAEVNGLDMEFE